MWGSRCKSCDQHRNINPIKMAKKKSFVLRLDPETLKAVEKWAADEFRSMNGQLEWMINKSLKEHRRIPKDKE